MERKGFGSAPFAGDEYGIGRRRFSKNGIDLRASHCLLAERRIGIGCFRSSGIRVGYLSAGSFGLCEEHWQSGEQSLSSGMANPKRLFAGGNCDGMVIVFFVSLPPDSFKRV